MIGGAPNAGGKVVRRITVCITARRTVNLFGRICILLVWTQYMVRGHELIKVFTCLKHGAEL